MGHDRGGRTQQLEDAFHLFNQMSSQLEASYQALENRVAQLNHELAAARSERLRQLAEKERLANRLERLLDVLPGGVVVVDEQGFVAECNPAAVDLLGEPLQGCLWHDVIQRAFQPYSDDGSEVTLHSGRRVSMSTRSLDPEPGQIVLLMDVTEQHALQHMLNRHRRLSAMGEMAASLAHQVRTPLASALLYVSHLARADLSDDGRRRFTDKVIGRLRHLERMINDMLQFARGGSFDMEDFPVELLVDEFTQSLEPQLQACCGELELQNQAAGSNLRGNREALQSALSNLATNAIEACGQRAQLCLEIRRNDQDELVLLLHDNGPGIPAAVQERLFTPFFTTRPNGTGLGLAVVRAIARAHQGDVWVTSKPGQGSTFGIRIPAAGGQDALPSGFHEPAVASQAPIEARSKPLLKIQA
jgi:two-component system sensor histidine kinase FlrB